MSTIFGDCWIHCASDSVSVHLNLNLVVLFSHSLWHPSIIVFFMGEYYKVKQEKLGSHLYSMRQMGGWFWSKSWVCAFTLKVKSLPWCFHSPPLSRPSPDHSSNPMNDTETSSPRKETPCFPKGRQSKVHCSSCLFVYMFLWKRQRKEWDWVNRQISWLPQAYRKAPKADFHTDSHSHSLF